jgi:histidinol phosphatase-like enzyme
MDKRPKTIICDIDGTLVLHRAPIDNTDPSSDLVLLNGTKEKILEWDSKGYNIILITGRKESMRKSTEAQLSRIGVIYDQLIMGIGGGERVLINDRKPDGRECAFSINLDRNEGISGLNI